MIHKFFTRQNVKKIHKVVECVYMTGIYVQTININTTVHKINVQDQFVLTSFSIYMNLNVHFVRGMGNVQMVNVYVIQGTFQMIVQLKLV